MQDLLQKHWHHLPASEVIDLLDTRGEGGLDQFEVAGRQERFGANALTPAKGKSPLQRFVQQFNQALVYIPVSYTHLQASRMACASKVPLLRRWR